MRSSIYAGPSGTTFHFSIEGADGVQVTSRTGTAITVTKDDLIGFVAELIRREKVRAAARECPYCLVGLSHECEGGS